MQSIFQRKVIDYLVYSTIPYFSEKELKSYVIDRLSYNFHIIFILRWKLFYSKTKTVIYWFYVGCVFLFTLFSIMNKEYQ